MKPEEQEMLDALKEAQFALNWMWKNTAVTNQDLQSDFFNIPANALTQIDKILKP